MTITIIFVIFFLLRVIQYTFLKRTSTKIEGRTQLLTYTAFQYFISAVLSIFLQSDFKRIFSVSPVGMAISVLGGIAMFCSSLCSMTALKSGVQLVLTSLFSSMSILVPTIASVFLFHEAMSIWQIVGMVALLYAAYLLLGITRSTYQNFSVKGFLLLCGLFLGDGLTMLAQKCYPNYEPSADTAVYTFLAFGTAFVLTAIMGGVDMAKEKTNVFRVLHKDLVLGGGILATMLFAIMYLGVLAVPLVSAVVLYSLVAGGTLIIAFLVGAIIFKEPVTKRNIIGLLISVLALVLINAF